MLQGPSEGISSVAFEVLIINCQIYLMNLLIFNCFPSNMIFSIHLFYVKFLFSENDIFPELKRAAVHVRAYLASNFKLTRENDDMMTCYLRDINKFLRYCTLYKSILKCGYPTKSTRLTWFVFLRNLDASALS